MGMAWAPSYHPHTSMMVVMHQCCVPSPLMTIPGRQQVEVGEIKLFVQGRCVGCTCTWVYNTPSTLSITPAPAPAAPWPALASPNVRRDMYGAQAWDIDVRHGPSSALLGGCKQAARHQTHPPATPAAPCLAAASPTDLSQLNACLVSGKAIVGCTMSGSCGLVGSLGRVCLWCRWFGDATPAQEHTHKGTKHAHNTHVPQQIDVRLPGGIPMYG